MIKVGIIGTGYVGLVTGACLSKWHQVICLDKDRNKIHSLKNGEIPFYEEGLEEIVKEGLQSGQLSFTHNFHEFLDNSDVIFLCLGTPSGKNTKSQPVACKLDAIYDVCLKLSLQARSTKLVVVKSTVPPGTNDELIRHLNKFNAEYHCASNPEFLREGRAVEDFLHPERIVLGVRDRRSLDLLLKIYAPLEANILPMNVRSAEMAKYACNAALATKISFINEISNICESTGANILAVREVMASDSRIGSQFYEQGPGYGGSCFPKDVAALIELAESVDEKTPVLNGVVETNEVQPYRVIEKLKKHLDLGKETKVAIWGAAFKAGTDDVRHSVTIPIVRELVKMGVEVRVHDPKAIDNIRKYLHKSVKCYNTNPVEMSIGADALVIATPWPEYKDIPVYEIGPYVIVDCRQLLNAEDVEYAGTIYEGFGV